MPDKESIQVPELKAIGPYLRRYVQQACYLWPVSQACWVRRARRAVTASKRSRVRHSGTCMRFCGRVAADPTSGSIPRCW